MRVDCRVEVNATVEYHDIASFAHLHGDNNEVHRLSRDAEWYQSTTKNMDQGIRNQESDPALS
jgi:hypothetical protein